LAVNQELSLKIIDELLSSLPDGPVRELQVGAFWTAVVVEVAGQRRCGLASTLRQNNHHHDGQPAVHDAGRLAESSGRQLAELARSYRPIEAGIGFAAINALLPVNRDLWLDSNAEEVIAHYGVGKRVVLIGHFPFIPRLRERVGTLQVLEQQPQGKDLPATAATKIVPRAEVVAITGTTLINHTFEVLLALCRPEAKVLLLGPSTPLSPILFDYGIHLLSGSVVEDIDSVLRPVSQGANFRQVHQQGVRLVTMQQQQLQPAVPSLRIALGVQRLLMASNGQISNWGAHPNTFAEL
jgi:uncharacterized protein (DUF4213/DUF364 family)